MVQNSIVYRIAKRVFGRAKSECMRIILDFNRIERKARGKVYRKLSDILTLKVASQGTMPQTPAMTFAGRVCPTIRSPTVR